MADTVESEMRQAVELAKSAYNDAAVYLGLNPDSYRVTTPNPKVYRDYPDLPGKLFVFLSNTGDPQIRVYIRRTAFPSGQFKLVAEKVVVGESGSRTVHALLVLSDGSQVSLFTPCP